MLGFGIGEIILIAIVAIIVLGPDKLPNALIEMAKFIRIIKKTVQDAKETLDREVNLAEIKKEAQAYKEKLEQSADISKDIKEANLIGEIQKDMNDIQHLFQDYQPKPVQLDTQSQQAKETTHKQTDSIQPNHTKDLHTTYNVNVASEMVATQSNDTNIQTLSNKDNIDSTTTHNQTQEQHIKAKPHEH